jgi:hypothetical protein
MSATIAAVAILYRLYGVEYVGGRRDDRGILIKGTELTARVSSRILIIIRLN